ncbi:MAG: hypothetical protein NTZ35_13585 [Ignavibacteriales bacterium]|nr:hypothetical protein [Ignavibacteriales bacterium]
MPQSCCSKPAITIIKVGFTEAGILGLEAALRNVHVSDAKDDEQIKNELLRWVRQFGNYVAPSLELEYKEALWREYRKYAAKAGGEATQKEGSKC